MVTMWRLDSRVVGGMEEAEGVLVAQFLLPLTHLHQGQQVIARLADFLRSTDALCT
jgi:hypothetical protein